MPGRKSLFYSIRPASSADWPSVAKLLEKAGLPASDLSSERMVDFRIAESAGGDSLGCIGIERYEPQALLRSLVIRPEARRLGIGCALIERLEAEAPGRGVLELWLLTNDAAGFFSRLGYAERPRGEAPGLDRTDPEILVAVSGFGHAHVSHHPCLNRRAALVSCPDSSHNFRVPYKADGTARSAGNGPVLAKERNAAIRLGLAYSGGSEIMRINRTGH